MFLGVTRLTFSDAYSIMIRVGALAKVDGQ